MSGDPQTTGLPDICTLVTDGTHDSPKIQPSGVPFIKGKHISSGRIDFETCDFIAEEDHTKCVKRVKPQVDDVLFANIGSVGDVARVTDEREFSIKNVALFRPDPSKVDPTYFYYLVVSSSFRGVFLNARSGAAQPFISLEAFRSHRFPFNPDKAQQHKTGIILSAYDDMIENNRRRMALLEEAARQLYREWFVRLRFPGHEHTRITDGVPDGWEKVKVGSLLLKVSRAQKIKKDDYAIEGTIPCVDQGSDFIGGYTDDPDALIEQPLPLIVFGDHTRVLKFVNFPFACGADGTQLIYPNTPKVSPEYLYCALNAIELSNYFYARHFKFLRNWRYLFPRNIWFASSQILLNPVSNRLK